MNSEKHHRFYAPWSAFIATLGGFLQSYTTCVIAGALFFISEEFQLSAINQGILASIILLGALVGACFCGYLADRLGRRRSLFIAAFLFIVTGVGVFYISSLSLLLALRFVTGIAAGLTSVLVPMYLAEIALASKRGAYVTSFQFSVTIGTLLAYLINISFMNSGDWRMMFFLAVIPAAFQFISLFFLPESPKWLTKVGRNAKAERVFEQLHGKVEFTTAAPKSLREGSWKELFNPSLRFVLAIGIILCVLQQFCGINAIIYFTPKIFQEAGFSAAKDAMLATLIVGCINFLSTFCSIFLIDRLGRKKLLLLSQLGVGFSLIVLIVAFITQIQFIDLIAVLALMTYVASYSIGLGPVTWVLISEIYPLAFRAKAMSVMTFLSWLSNYLVVLSFPYFVSSMGSVFTFSIYTVVCLFGYFFIRRYIPETKGKTLEELEATLCVKRSK